MTQTRIGAREAEVLTGTRQLSRMFMWHRGAQETVYVFAGTYEHCYPVKGRPQRSGLPARS